MNKQFFGRLAYSHQVDSNSDNWRERDKV